MKRLLIANLSEGHILAEDVLINGSQLLVPKGIILTKNLISLLETNQILSVKVEDTVVSTKKIQPMTYIERIRNSREFFQFKHGYETCVNNIAKSMNDLVEKNMPFHVDRFISDLLNLFESSGQSGNVLDFLISMREYDDSTFCHSINVALLCGIFADWLHLTETQKELAIISGLFHDIGKLQIPKKIIQKPGSLTAEEYKIIKKHPELGYHILCRKDIDDKLSEHVKAAALMHHEKCDGSGYPLGLTLHRIDFYAKMVAIVDVYDAMTSARVYRKPLCPFTVISHFEDEGLQKYDAEMLLVFLDHVVNTYINHSVELSNGKMGNIIYINKVSLSKPTIKVDDTFVDLAKEDHIFIEKLL